MVMSSVIIFSDVITSS